MTVNVIYANWPAPKSVKALVTLRGKGLSKGIYYAFNLAKHTGDNLKTVEANRSLLIQSLQLPSPPHWLNQVHGTQVIEAQASGYEQEADASISRERGTVCAVLTADCLPVLLCDCHGSLVVAVHAGWQGLAAGILEITIAKTGVPSQELMVWLGPAISQKHFEIGFDVCQKLIAAEEDWKCFIPYGNNRYKGDLYQLAKNRLKRLGITKIYGGTYCSVSQSHLFYSYRRDGLKSGRMASLIWLDT